MAKLVLKYGDAMVEYEGPEGFLKEELPQIVKAVGELRNVAPPIQSHEPVGDIPLALGDAANASVSTIAQKLTTCSRPLRCPSRSADPPRSQNNRSELAREKQRRFGKSPMGITSTSTSTVWLALDVSIT
jgi:hypothetical protein